MNKIIERIEKHNKAIAYAFLDKVRNVDSYKIEWKTNKQALLVLNQERRVLYINGDVSRECAYQKYLAWFNQNINQSNRNYIKNTLLYDGYGFVEYIDDFSWKQDDVNSEYYLKYGELIAIIWSLNGRLILPKEVGLKDGMPVIKSVCALLDKEVVYRELPMASQIQELLEQYSVKKEVAQQIVLGYISQRDFIVKNKSDIEALIRLCFGGVDG